MRLKWSASAAMITIPVWLPVIDVTVSVAVIDWLPAVLSVTLNEPVPPVSVPSDGSTAAPVLAKWTVPV